MNASRRARYKRLLKEHISVTPDKYKHRDLLPSAAKKDMAAVEKVIHVVEELFSNPWEGNALISFSSGLYAPPELVDDLLNAKAKGLEDCTNFIQLRCSDKPSLGFFETFTKCKLKNFSSLKKVVSVKSKDRTLPLKMDKELFACITLLSQHRKIDLKEVFKYPAGPLPWSLADPFGLPKKTNKATLMRNIEKEGELDYPVGATAVYDAMAVLQKFQPAGRCTFGDVAKALFKIFISTPSNFIHVVFDKYLHLAIKNMERLRRGNSTDGVQYKNILPSHPVKSWTKFMSSPHNKQEIVKFLAGEWRKDEYRCQLKGKTFFVTEDDACWKVTEDEADNVPILECTHEEADTRMILHCQYSQGPVVIHSDDADVFIILLGHLADLPPCFMKVGKGGKTRVLDMCSIMARISSQYSENILQAFIGLHVLTGCDSVSAFVGKGKIKALKLLQKFPEFLSCLVDLGKSWIVTDELVNDLIRFVCALYGKFMDDIDLLRYQLFLAKNGKDPEALPPCRSSLTLHIQRANYQACTWRRAIVPKPVVPSPCQHGWILNDDLLSVKWLGSSPAPDEVLELISCLCKRTCKADDCVCMQAQLKCTSLCIARCDNMVADDATIADVEETEDDDDDSESDLSEDEDLCDVDI